MIKFLTLVTHVALVSFNSQAQPLEQIRKQIYEGLGACDKAVFTDDDYMAASMPEAVFGVGQVKIFPLKNQTHVIQLHASNRVVDIKIKNEIAYVLTDISLEAWNLANLKQIFAYPTHPAMARMMGRPKVRNSLGWREMAQGFVVRGNTAVIAHGTLGVSILDLLSGQVIRTIPLKTASAAQDVDLLNDHQVVLAIDNNEERAFRGMTVLDLNNYTYVQDFLVDNAFPSAVRVLDHDRLMLIYFNAVWRFRLSDVTKTLPAKKSWSFKNYFGRSSGLEVIRRAWNFPDLYVVDIVGKIAIDQKNLYACFKTASENSSARPIKPLAFELKTLKLD